MKTTVSEVEKKELNTDRLVLDVVKEREKDDVRVLSTGVRARLHYVAGNTIGKVVSKVKDPKIPMWHNPDKDRDEENPNDPDYIVEVDKVNADRNEAIMDTLIILGCKLVDPLPPDDEWLPDLQFLAKRTGLDLNIFDWDDPQEKGFVYKKYVALGARDLTELSKMAGITQEEVDIAVKSF